MIYLIGKSTAEIPDRYYGSWEMFSQWVNDLHMVEVDLETNVSTWWCDKYIVTIQFGYADTQWVLQWSELSSKQKLGIKQILESTLVVKLAHNAAFECIMMLFYNIRMRNVICTMLQEQVIYGGEQNTVDYSLAAVAKRRLNIDLDKTEQSNFGDNVLTLSKLLYAAQDVTYLTPIHHKQLSDLRAIRDQFNPDGLIKTAELENKSLLAFAEMVYNGMGMDPDWWRNLQDEAEPLIAEAHEKLNAWLSQPPFLEKALQLGYIAKTDRMLINWDSPKQKDFIFKALFPFIPGTSRAIVQKLLKSKDFMLAHGRLCSWLPSYAKGDYSDLEKHLLDNERDFLINHHLLIPTGMVTINWNSVDQTLPIMQCVEPQMKDMSEESRGRASHPIMRDYEDFKDSLKLISTYGTSFLEKYLEPDGKVRTRFNQVLTTGRISSSSPPMQQIPAKEAVGNKYRNGFIAPEGWVYVSSDFISQELIVVAYLSKDPVWLEALSKGQDLHSTTAEMIYKDKWKSAASPTCEFYFSYVDRKGVYHPANSKSKCSCHKHKYMRSAIKSINFGLIYGMSHFKLASDLRITVPEAKQLIAEYFTAFPGIKGLLDYLGGFGVRNGYIQTIPPYFRRRWFPNWKYYRNYADEHLSGIRYHDQLGIIERASKNMPIQGSSADITKLALCLIYDYIHDNHLEDKVKLIMQVHDQVDTIAKREYAETWAPILTMLMEKAAAQVITTGILKAETTITERWSK